MRELALSFFLALTVIPLFAQQDTTDFVIDNKYREDQFYIGLTYNVFPNKPEGLTQNGFSGGVHAGFLRDFPLNKRRNIAVAAGIGWSFNVYNHNLFIGEDHQDQSIFQLLKRDEVHYDSNRFNVYLVELPIEFRWRSSTPSVYNFWRIYGGFKFGYIYYFKSNFEQPENRVQQTQVDELKRLRMGATLSVGKDKFNIHLYYGFNSLFDGVLLDGQEIEITTLKVGLIFYIL